MQFSESIFNVTKDECTDSYDGQNHSSTVSVDIEGAVIKYSSALEGPYTEEPIAFINSGEYSSYYSVAKEGYYTAYGTLLTTIKPDEHVFIYRTNKVKPNKIEALCTDLNCKFHDPMIVELNLGDIKELTVAVSPENAPDKTVTWASSNPSVVSVDQNGFISANKLSGNAVITATLNDGSGAMGTAFVKIGE